MCVIAYKPEGVKFPSDNIIENCFDNNPNGAGFMYCAKDGVHIQKGFMKLSDFMDAIEPFKNMTDMPFVMHFRITTHGGTSPEMTQPFPLTGKTKKLKRLETVSRVGVAHNGIIPLTDNAKSISDTALFIKRYMTMLVKNAQYYKDSRVGEMIAEMIGSSKMLIMSQDGHIEMLNKGWVYDKGMWFSNDSFKDFSYTKWLKSSKSKSTGSCYAWDSWYDGFDPYEGTYGYIDDHTWNSYIDNARNMSDEEADEWLDFREQCQDRIDSKGMYCYGCPYVDSCYAI